MPRYWHDRHSVNQIEDPEERRFQLSILADKKPYFMRYIYTTLTKQYNTYIKTTNKNARREFGISLEELERIPDQDRTERQSDFLRYYHNRMPVGIGDCVMNKICRRFEQEFDGYLKRYKPITTFDVSILKGNSSYSKTEFREINKIYDNYCSRLKQYMSYVAVEHVSEDDYSSMFIELKNEFEAACGVACPNTKSLCDIILDLCYEKSSTKKFAWDMCGTDMINNLLNKNNHTLMCPTQYPDGDIIFCGKKFKVDMVKMEGFNGDCTE